MEFPPKDIDEISEDEYIYNLRNLPEMVNDDLITPEEQGFMQGYIESIET